MASEYGRPVDERDAGDFGSWLGAFTRAVSAGQAVDVPCAGCTACCRSGKLIPVEADELDTLALLPADALVPMPGQPAARVLAHDESGRCRQLTPSGCAVYAHRPRACRAYDCRVFAASGVTPDKPLIAEQVARWRFGYAAEHDRARHLAVRSAAVMLGMPGGLTAPASPTQHALEAIGAAAEAAG